MNNKRTETGMGWLGHMGRKTEEYVVMRTWKMEVGGHRHKGRRKRRWIVIIRKYMKMK